MAFVELKNIRFSLVELCVGYREYSMDSSITYSFSVVKFFKQMVYSHLRNSTLYIFGCFYFIIIILNILTTECLM